MSLICTSQDIVIDFNLISDALTMEIFSNDALEIEEQIMDAIELCNTDDNVDITSMTIIEGGIDSSIDSTSQKLDADLGIHMIITCDIEFDAMYFDETDGIEINLNKFIQYLKSLYLIGEYVDDSSVDVSIYDYSDDYDYVADDPDYDSMPGGHDYYED